MGAGTFSEKGGEERSNFFGFAPPIFDIAYPGFSVLGGQKHIVAHLNY